MDVKENNLKKGCDENLISMAKIIQSLLLENGVEADIMHIRQGPRLNHVVLSLKAGFRYNSIIRLQNEIQLALNVSALRIEAPIPGYDLIGLEFPRKDPEEVTYQNTTVVKLDMLKAYGSKVKLPIVIGRDVEGVIRSADLVDAPHLLVGGARGQGVSQFMHSMICGLIFSRSPDELQLLMVDPCGVELAPYAGLPHLAVSVIKDRRKIVFALHWAVAEMERRLLMFAKARVRNIADFVSRDPNMSESDLFSDDIPMDDMPATVPYIVIVLNGIDDVIETVGEEIMFDIARLTARGRASGIHVVVISERSEAIGDFATFKYNIPMRVALKTDTETWSEMVIDEKGAERLLGDGDGLAQLRDGIIRRIQTPAITNKEIESVVAEAIRRGYTEKYGATKMVEKMITIGEDDLEVLECVADKKRIMPETLILDIVHDHVIKMKGGKAWNNAMQDSAIWL